MNEVLPASAASGGAGGPSSSPEFNFRGAATIPPIRNDLKITPVSFRGMASYVVKDPVSLSYFRWGEREFKLASLLDGRATVSEVLDAMRRSFPDDDYDAADLEADVSRFLSAGLLLTNAGLAARLHHQRASRMSKMKRSRLWLTLPAKLIAFKITLFDPDLLLLRMERKLSFLWSWRSVIVLLAMMAVSGWLILRDTSTLGDKVPDIFGWQNLLIMWVVMILVKVVHEFGHGLSCKHFGGEVHEMGAMFIVFSPFLFCNATDSWVFREKWKRLVVNFGGIYLELFLAAAAAALWVLTAPGFFNQICFNVMLVCSIMTIFFNANPLMKFDGYYALSDWIEVPNLKERGDKALVGRIAGVFTGSEWVERDSMVERFKLPILVYAVASYAWTFFVAYNILRGLGYMLQPYGLDRIVQSAAGFVLFVGILAPPLVVANKVGKTVRADEDGHVLRRVAVVLAVLLSVAGLLAFLPVPVSVKTACVMQGANMIPVTASTPGFIRSVEVRDGSPVREGEVLATLSNEAMLAEHRMMELDLQAVRSAGDAAIAGGDDARVPLLRALAAQYSAAVAKRGADLEALVLRSPVDGIVLGRDLPSSVGLFLARGGGFCEIMPDGPMEAVVALTESEAGLVTPGAPVTFRLSADPRRVWSGRVLSVSRTPSDGLPHQSLGAHAGGTVPANVAPQGLSASDSGAAVPIANVYSARVALDNADGALRPGYSGRLKIDAGKRSLGDVAKRWFTSMLRADFRL
jgi:putative peptide zinc metalloprotease protein